MITDNELAATAAADDPRDLARELRATYAGAFDQRNPKHVKAVSALIDRLCIALGVDDDGSSVAEPAREREPDPWIASDNGTTPL